MAIPWHSGELPYLTAQQMAAVDRAMITDFHITLLQMMENAGRQLAELARVRFLAGDPRGKRVVVLAGSGGNGGGALVAARRLANYGAQVRVYLSRDIEQFAEAPTHQLKILECMQVAGLPAKEIEMQAGADLILDGLIGYSLRGAPRGPVADLIHWANAQTAPILALDLPSGLDATSGEIYAPAVRAAATLTLALPKVGLRAAAAKVNVGELYLADISVPPRLYRGSGLSLEVGPIFAESDLVRLW